MLFCALLCSSVLAADPVVILSYQAKTARLSVTPPAGEHPAPDQPAELTLTAGATTLTVHRQGGLDGLQLPVDAGPVKAIVQLAFCTDNGAICRTMQLQASGTLDRKTPLQLTAVAPPAPVAGGGTVARIYDFTAVWCPPCNRMSAEVLHNPEYTPALAPYELVAVDVDQPESWSLKDRYAVGGYPTLVAVAADGAEVARMIGYPGPEETVRWLEGLPALSPLASLESGPVLSGADAAAAARRLAEADKTDAARRQLGGAAGVDNVDTKIAQLLLDEDAAAARWLFEQKAPLGDWVFAALSADPTLRDAVIPRLGEVDALAAADYLAAGAEGADPVVARVMYGSAIALIESALSGDPVLDRGNYVFLADLYVEIGDTAHALALLQEASQTFPAEFTFDHARTRLLLDAKRFAEAEATGREALRKAYGDQRYRAAMNLAKALDGQGRRADALAVLDAVLAELPAPTADMDVRTHRYRKQVEELRGSLQAADKRERTE